MPGPSVTFESGPQDPTPTSDPTPTFTFSSADPLATFECAVDGEQPSACSSPYTTPLLADGPHTLSVRAVDALQNQGDWVNRGFTVDVTAPDVAIDSGPPDSSTTGDPTPTFGFSSPDLGATFQCLVDGGQATACDSPFTTAPLSDGPHSFEVRAVDAAGNAGSASSSFTVDTVPPDVTIDAGPRDPTPTADTTPTFLFSSNDTAARFQCSIDGGSFDDCASPHTTATLSQGPHRLEVRAFDAAGNQGPAVARSFTVDSSVPAVTFTAGPEGPTREQRPMFAFTSAPGATFTCKLDGAAVPCASGTFTPGADLSDGEHFFEAAATSPAGVAGSWAVRVFVVDTTGPETVIITTPPAQTTERTPRIEFVGSEAGAAFECSVDGGRFVSCASPWTTPSLALGPHRVEVRALDALGNADGSPALAEFTVAAPPPPPPAVVNVDAGVKQLAGSLVLDLDRAARSLATTEIKTILGRARVTVPEVSALVPGTLAVRASAPARGSTKTVLAGSHGFAGPGTASLVLRPTRAGRRMMARYGTIPLLVQARFTTTDGLALSANREAQLVRDYLTAAEAKRAVARRLAGIESGRVKSLAVRVTRRCASNCLRVQATWVAKQRRRTAAGRARQVDGRLVAQLQEIVSARH